MSLLLGDGTIAHVSHLFGLNNAAMECKARGCVVAPA
jgi:hypothetical protein